MKYYAIVYDNKGDLFVGKKNEYGYFFQERFTIPVWPLNGGDEYCFPGGSPNDNTSASASTSTSSTGLNNPSNNPDPIEEAKKEFKQETGIDLNSSAQIVDTKTYNTSEYYAVYFQVSPEELLDLITKISNNLKNKYTYYNKAFISYNLIFNKAYQYTQGSFNKDCRNKLKEDNFFKTKDIETVMKIISAPLILKNQSTPFLQIAIRSQIYPDISYKADIVKLLEKYSESIKDRKEKKSFDDKHNIFLNKCLSLIDYVGKTINSMALNSINEIKNFSVKSANNSISNLCEDDELNSCGKVEMIRLLNSNTYFQQGNENTGWFYKMCTKLCELRPQIFKTSFNSNNTNTSVDNPDPIASTSGSNNTQTPPDSTPPADGSTAQPTDGSTAQPTDDSTAQPTDDSTAPPADDSTAQPADGSTAQPADSSTAQPADGSTAQPTDDSTAQPTDDSTAQPADGSTAQPTDDSTAPPTDDSTAPPADGSTAQPTDDSTAPPADGSTAQPTDDSTAQPTDDSTAPPTDDSTAPPADGSTAQPTDDSTA